MVTSTFFFLPANIYFLSYHKRTLCSTASCQLSVSTNSFLRFLLLFTRYKWTVTDFSVMANPLSQSSFTSYLTHALFHAILSKDKNNIKHIFRAGCKSLPVVKPTSRKAWFGDCNSEFQSRQYSLDERRFLAKEGRNI